jgi:hypothetical protein
MKKVRTIKLFGIPVYKEVVMEIDTVKDAVYDLLRSNVTSPEGFVPQSATITGSPKPSVPEKGH